MNFLFKIFLMFSVVRNELQNFNNAKIEQLIKDHKSLINGILEFTDENKFSNYGEYLIKSLIEIKIFIDKDFDFKKAIFLLFKDKDKDDFSSFINISLPGLSYEKLSEIEKDFEEFYKSKEIKSEFLPNLEMKDYNLQNLNNYVENYQYFRCPVRCENFSTNQICEGGCKLIIPRFGNIKGAFFTGDWYISYLFNTKQLIIYSIKNETPNNKNIKFLSNSVIKNQLGFIGTSIQKVIEIKEMKASCILEDHTQPLLNEVDECVNKKDFDYKIIDCGKIEIQSTANNYCFPKGSTLAKQGRIIYLLSKLGDDIKMEYAKICFEKIPEKPLSFEHWNILIPFEPKLIF